MYKISREINARKNEIVKVFDSENKKIISLNSEISPIKEIERFGSKFTNNKSYIIIGSGNGTLLDYILEKNLNSKFYIIEIFDDIDYEEEYINKLNEINVNFYHSSNLNYLEISGAIRNSLGMEFEILIHPNYDRLNENLTKPILEKIKMGSVTATLNKNTEKYFMYEWLTEPILNLSISKTAKSLLELKEHFINKPFILISSGPSLIENLDFVKKNKDNAYVIASGSAVNGLMNNGIHPDFVTVIDGSDINYTAHFKDTKYDGPLITTGTTNHSILKNHLGDILVTNIAQDTVTKEERPDLIMVPTVPSVALYSLMLTHFLGAKDVYMVGQDLALANGQYYASGVNEHKNMKNLGQTIEVEDNQGGKVFTTLPLATTLESFNNVISVIQMANKSIHIYNLAKDGAKISGVAYKPADEIKFNGKVDKSWINRAGEKNTPNYSYSIEFLQKIKDCKYEVDDVVRKINRMNSAAVTLKDLKKILQLIKKLRENEVLEIHVLNMIYSTTKSINNMFEFGFDGNFETNEERVEMLNKIKFFVEHIQKYLIGFEDSPAWSEFE
ncbi:motility associated factor glycosyltransferase family protein [Viridibacillus arvi]|uniref:motility associated factor glycosyltransferase family protein n=1 Tax=Viridibacillus arvi TaxID=263475 RepID=UPI0036E1916E